MSKVISPQKRSFASTRLAVLSPYRMYIEQVRGVSDKIRATSKGLAYYPAQFGGLKGQRENLNSEVVVQLVDFENNE